MGSKNMAVFLPWRFIVFLRVLSFTFSDDQSDSASTVIVNEGPGLGPSSRLNLGVDFSDITLDDLEPRDRTKSVGSTQAYTETMTDDMDDMDGGFNLADVNPSVAPIGQAGDQIGDGTEKPEVKFDADGKEYLEAAPGAVSLGFSYCRALTNSRSYNWVDL